MQTFKRASVLFAIALFALALICFGTPQLYLMLACLKISRADAAAVRRRVGRWEMGWLDIAYRLLVSITGISVTFRIPEHPSVRGKDPFIIVANHHGGFDGLLLSRLLTLTGRRDFRAVVKRQIGLWPIVGRSSRAAGHIFVSRSKDPKDIFLVERGAAAANAEGASIFIFPEGTTFHPSKVRIGHTHVLPPKCGGLKALLRAIPGCPILSVTILWHDYRAGRAWFDGVVPPGNRVTVDVSVVEGLGEADAETWLAAEWRRKDAFLAAAIDGA